ncbi:MAG: Na+/H+ antiporter subunit D, partial [Candidatus Altiarchaeales archaeon]
MVSINILHPGMIFIIGAFLIPILKGNLRRIYLLFIPSFAFLNLLYMQKGIYWTYRFLDYDIVFGRIDTISLCFAYVFLIFAFLGIIYALHLKENGQHIAAFIYIGSSLGVVFSGDLLSLFIFWEIMALSSVFLIWYQKERKSLDAGFRYLLVHAFGGSCLFAGIIIHLVNTNSIIFDYIGLNGLDSFLILIGFLLNAAVPPLHAWLSDAYPEAT